MIRERFISSSPRENNSINIQLTDKFPLLSVCSTPAIFLYRNSQTLHKKTAEGIDWVIDSWLTYSVSLKSSLLVWFGEDPILRGQDVVKQTAQLTFTFVWVELQWKKSNGCGVFSFFLFVFLEDSPHNLLTKKVNSGQIERNTQSRSKKLVNKHKKWRKHNS